MQKTCKRCRNFFECKVENIADCLCTTVTISEKVNQSISKQYTDCLCLQCIIELQEMENNLEDRIRKSETRIFKAVFPNTTNHYDTLFGGTALQLMDEAAFICATRFSRKKVVTVSSDKVDFNTPIPGGTLIELVACVDEVGTKSVKVSVEIFIEQMYSEHRESAIKGTFTMVAVDKNKKAISIL